MLCHNICSEKTLPSISLSVRKMSLFLSLPVSRRSSLLMVEGGGGGGGAKSYFGEKAWPSINHSILFDVYSKITYKLKNILKSAVLSAYEDAFLFTSWRKIGMDKLCKLMLKMTVRNVHHSC
jgi:hypothetical protein